MVLWMKLICSFVLRTVLPYSVLTILKICAEKITSTAVLEINLADAEHRLGVSNVQLSDACQELADAKTLLGDSHITLFGSLDPLSAQ